MQGFFINCFIDIIDPMEFYQKELTLKPYPRGFHLITHEITSAFEEIRNLKRGFLQVFIKHTSASLSLNENADPTVRLDFESHFNQMVPEDMPYYQHTFEGSDDMPAHIKAALLGNQLLLPLKQGRLCLGTWQGIYLCEHRDRGGARQLVCTAFGES